MKQAFAVIGANFGDEGKGLMTDWFCRQYPGALNVRTNGGAQAGHTVCTPQGDRHVFSHFGAGSFAEADTYLSEFFSVNPMLFQKERTDPALKLGKIYADRSYAVTLPCDMLLNQFAERGRGEFRHGSCGIGIYETLLRSKKSEFCIRFGDISDIPECRRILADRMREIHEKYCVNRAKELGIRGDAFTALFELINNECVIENYIDDLITMLSQCVLTTSGILEQYETVVFEGAQGLLLDMDRRDYFPHLTPSNTGMKNILALLQSVPQCPTEICYITRSFFTRHGAGRFDTESSQLAEKYGLYDKTNAPNEFQGAFRYGWFDQSAFAESLKLDRKYVPDYAKISAAVTHLDMSGGAVLLEQGEESPELIRKLADAVKLYKVCGETADDVTAE